jgi:hypothetical protein
MSCERWLREFLAARTAAAVRTTAGGGRNVGPRNSRERQREIDAAEREFES